MIIAFSFSDISLDLKIYNFQMNHLKNLYEIGNKKLNIFLTENAYFMNELNKINFLMIAQQKFRI